MATQTKKAGAKPAPVEAPEIPGVDDNLTEGEREAVDALRNLAQLQKENKLARKSMKENEDAAELLAYKALEALGLVKVQPVETGAVGPAMFTSDHKRKLKVAIRDLKEKGAAAGK